MTEKQKHLVMWITEMTGVRYNPKTNLSEYINEWRPKAEHENGAALVLSVNLKISANGASYVTVNLTVIVLKKKSVNVTWKCYTKVML